MTDRCEPPPELRGVDGWHWVQDTGAKKRFGAAQWLAKQRVWLVLPETEMFYCTPVEAGRYDWLYISPVATPAEVEALRAERDAMFAEARKAARNEAIAVAGQAILREEAATLRARVAELEGALREMQSAVHAIPLLTASDFDAELTTRFLRADTAARAALSPTPTGATP